MESYFFRVLPSTFLLTWSNPKRALKSAQEQQDRRRRRNKRDRARAWGSHAKNQSYAKACKSGPPDRFWLPKMVLSCQNWFKLCPCPCPCQRGRRRGGRGGSCPPTFESWGAQPLQFFTSTHAPFLTRPPLFSTCSYPSACAYVSTFHPNPPTHHSI